ncbi:MAG: hypothetical protein P8I03_06785 [Thalassotalea sp.]|nr:hypothetical protein [Thalassotalea sp.]
MKLKSFVNKLEAQFNFQTMTAGWYGDEDNIVGICFSLESPESFEQVTSNTQLLDKITLADDVISFFDQEKNLRICFVAITETEQNLLEQHTKLLKGYIDKKLSKALNLLTNELDVPEI